jgi:transposase-like protein
MVQANTRPATLVQAVRHFDADTAYAYVESIKAPNGHACPKCGSVNVGTIKGRRLWQCREKGCRKQFSLTAGTIMEGTHLRLEDWCVAVWMIISCRNGVSSCEIARTIGCKQQSAWHLLHRVRHILKAEHAGQLCGEVESDETFVGGLAKYMHADKRAEIKWNPRFGKAVVHALFERHSGDVRAQVIPGAVRKHLRPAVEANVEPGSRLYTDAAWAYRFAHEQYIHQWVNHMERYVEGSVHTNSLENYFSCLRRSIKGTYVAVEPEHLEAYVDEQSYRFNVRHESEWERFDGAMRMIVGKRLTYKVLTDGATR